MDEQGPTSNNDLRKGFVNGGIVNSIVILVLAIALAIQVSQSGEWHLTYLIWYAMVWFVINILVLMIQGIRTPRLSMEFLQGYASSLIVLLIVGGCLGVVMSGVFLMVDCFSNSYF